MSETGWGRGYFEGSFYTCGFYRETAPNWLDFCAVLRGIKPPREPGSAFKYLELGSGMGLNLCMLAAAYPEASFVGVDFNTDHIAHSISLAEKLRLSNISFVEADFTALAQSDGVSRRYKNLAPDIYDYVSLHGVLTWIKDSIRHDLADCIATFAKPGGLIYCSYNTNPGWQAGAIYRQIAESERRRESKATPSNAYERAAKKLASLLEYADKQPSSLSRQAPGIPSLIEEVRQQSPFYVLHEYANQGWAPLYVDEAHALLGSRQIHFIASANPPELLPELVPEKIRKILDEEPDPTHRELLYDITVYRRFRRDIFTKGRPLLSLNEKNARLEATILTDTRRPDHKATPVQTDFGEVRFDDVLLEKLFKALKANPCSLRHLAETLDQSLEHIAGTASMLLHQNAIAIASPVPTGAASLGEQVNTRLLRLICDGYPYDNLAAPYIGSALSITQSDARSLQSHLNNNNDEAAVSIRDLVLLLRRVGGIN